MTGSERPTDRLREAAEPAWTEATTHRFVSELGAGDVDDAVFRRYLVQDYAFLGELAALVGRAVADAPDLAAQARFAEFLTTVVGPENDYFERALDALGVPGSERPPAPDRATRAFGDLFAHAGNAGGYAETLAALLPVEWIYLTWASGVAEPPEPFYLGEWVRIHATQEFAAFVEWLREELDREMTELPECRRDRVERLFVDAVRHEVSFFDAAYAAGGD